MNIKSKLLNLSELARRIGTKPGILYNRLHGIGKHKALTNDELIKLETIIKNDLGL